MLGGSANAFIGCSSVRSCPLQSWQTQSEPCISKLLETVADAALRRPRAVQARREPRSGPVRPLDAGGVVAARQPLPTTSGCTAIGVQFGFRFYIRAQTVYSEDPMPEAYLK